MLTVREIAYFLEKWAPRAVAETYDNVGLQVGRMDMAVNGVLVALDLTHDVIDEAKRLGANLIITHHPNIFRPVKNVSDAGYVSYLALRLAEERIAHYAFHTNLDNAKDGVSFALAKLLGLGKVRFLDEKEDILQVLVVYAPQSHAELVQRAISDAGAGIIGDYNACAFASEGTGYFRPEGTAHPYVGKKYEINAEPEVRIECQVEKWRLQGVLHALKAAHPYEEVAYHVFQAHQPSKNYGLGAIGELPDAMLLDEYLERICCLLRTKAIRVVGAAEMSVKKVAVCGGSGGSFIALAMFSGADLYITADLTYHQNFDVLNQNGQPKMALVDVGHYESEWITEELVVNKLKEWQPKLEVHRTGHSTNPTRMFVAQETIKAVA
ncbi:MAG: Nif3-like dinuclear metal center hexameric protein [Rhodothermia bacterium]|nr:Nif3-like dinuclear metal center hexameric protein [Rhodothermia bacterium]